MFDTLWYQSCLQAVRILALFQEKFVLRQVMKVPPHLRSEASFEQAYSDLVKALVPVRGVFQASDNYSPRKTIDSQPADKTSCVAPGNSTAESAGPQLSMAALSNTEASKEEKADVISNNSLPCEPDKLPCSNHISSTDTKHAQDLAVKVMENPTLSNSHDNSQNCATSFETQSLCQRGNRQERELDVALSICGITEHSLPKEPPSPTPPIQTIVSPPLTPNTINLAADVQNLLDTLNSPLEPVPSIKVPTLSRYNRYYRHSVKKASFKRGGLPNNEEKQTPTVPNTLVITCVEAFLVIIGSLTMG